MRENGMQTEAVSTPASTADELLKVLIDKVVDNGEKVGKVNERIQKLQEFIEVRTSDQQKLEEISKTIKDEVAELKLRSVDPGMLWASIVNLQTDFQRYEKVFKNPQLKEVHHKHFVGKSLITIFALSAIVVVQFVWLNIIWNDKAQFAENDIKWKAVKLSMDTTVTNSLYKIQKDYNSSPDQFRKDVMAEEERRAELSLREAQAWEYLQQIQKLKAAKKR